MSTRQAGSVTWRSEEEEEAENIVAPKFFFCSFSHLKLLLSLLFFVLSPLYTRLTLSLEVAEKEEG